MKKLHCFRVAFSLPTFLSKEAAHGIAVSFPLPNRCCAIIQHLLASPLPVSGPASTICKQLKFLVFLVPGRRLVISHWPVNHLLDTLAVLVVFTVFQTPSLVPVLLYGQLFPFFVESTISWYIYAYLLMLKSTLSATSSSHTGATAEILSILPILSIAPLQVS